MIQRRKRKKSVKERKKPGRSVKSSFNGENIEEDVSSAGAQRFAARKV